MGHGHKVDLNMFLKDPEAPCAGWASIGICCLAGENEVFMKRERKFTDDQELLWYGQTAGCDVQN
jgi:hypothetical protein